VTYDAVVIGAGPAGSTAALMLARAGWSVAVVEKAKFPRRKVCGEFISATSLPLLQEIGVAEPFLERAGPEVRRVGLFAQDTLLNSAMPPTSGSGGRWGRALGREQLDLILLEAAARAGARLWRPWSATDLRPGQDGFVCTIATKSGSVELVGRIVIAAPGSWERNAWIIPEPGGHKPSDLLAFKAHFADADLPADLMPLLVFPGGYGGMVHSDGGRVTLSCCIRRDMLQACRRRYPTAHAGNAVLQHIRVSCRGVRDALRHARLAGGWLSSGPIRPGIRKRYSAGIFRIGNIAGEAHPIVAEGISMAMQSSWLLCRQLIADQEGAVSGRARAQVARAYQAEWQKAFAGRIHAAAVFAHLVMRPNITALWLPTLKRFPGILTFGAQLSGKATQLVPFDRHSGAPQSGEPGNP
jgi:flavin-dependent dehydrogenase